nr:hypothetical protein GCM10020093_067090 [Planobispora longispora]
MSELIGPSGPPEPISRRRTASGSSSAQAAAGVRERFTSRPPPCSRSVRAEVISTQRLRSRASWAAEWTGWASAGSWASSGKSVRDGGTTIDGSSGVSARSQGPGSKPAEPRNRRNP